MRAMSFRRGSRRRAKRLMDRLRADWLPPEFTRAHLTCGGSEGIETAMKAALQYQYARGRPEKSRIVSHSVSYHGTTLATTAVGGHEARRFGLAHALPEVPFIANAGSPALSWRRSRKLLCRRLRAHHRARGSGTHRGVRRGTHHRRERRRHSAARQLLARGTPHPCDEHDIVLIADEVMTGFGRTGLAFGPPALGPVAPDIFVSGKGLTGGYAPLTGIFADGCHRRTLGRTQA